MYDVSEEQRRRDGAEVGDGHQTAEHAQRGGQVLAHLVEVELAARRQADEAEGNIVEPGELGRLLGGHDVCAVRTGDHAEEEEGGDGGEAQPGQQRAKGVRRHPDDEEEEEGGRDLAGALGHAAGEPAVHQARLRLAHLLAEARRVPLRLGRVMLLLLLLLRQRQRLRLPLRLALRLAVRLAGPRLFRRVHLHRLRLHRLRLHLLRSRRRRRSPCAASAQIKVARSAREEA